MNCEHNLASYARLSERFAKSGVLVIGVHTPETGPEHVPANVRRSVKAKGIKYPVLLDPEADNWNRWRVRAWPTLFLVDKKGFIRYLWEGELNFNDEEGESKMAKRVEALLKEKG